MVRGLAVMAGLLAVMVLAGPGWAQDQAKTDKIALAKKILREASAVAMAIPDEGEKELLLEPIAKAQAVVGDFDGLQETIDGFAANDGISYEFTRNWYLSEIALNRAHRARDFQGALKLAALIRDKKLQNTTWAGIARNQAISGDLEGARRTASLIEDPYIMTDALASIGEFSRALETAPLIKDPRDREIALENIAGEQAGKGDFRGALETIALIKFEELFRTIGLERIARAQAKAGDIQEAFATAAMIRPNSEALVFRTWIHATTGNIQEGQKTAGKIADSKNKGIALRSIVDAQIRGGDLKGALATAAMIEDKQEKNLAFIGVVKAQAQAGDIQDALETAAKIEGHGLSRQAYKEIVEAQLQKGDIAGALQTTTRSDVGDVVATAIVGVQVKSGDIAGARKTAAFVHHSHPHMGGGPWYAIVEAQAARGDMEGAMETVALIHDDLMKAYVLKRLAVIQAKNGDFAVARKTAGMVSKSYIRTCAERELARVQAQTGEFQGAAATAAAINYPYERALTWFDITATRAGAGDVAGAYGEALIRWSSFDKGHALVGAASGLLGITRDTLLPQFIGELC